MRLTKLYIHNYKSFYDTTIELDKMNIVVGENNSGKSNLIDVLEFISSITKDSIDKIILDRGGLEKILNYNYSEKRIYIELEMECKSFKTKKRFTLSQNRETIVISQITYRKKDNKLLPMSIMGTRGNFKLKKTINKQKVCQANLLKFHLDGNIIDDKEMLSLHIDDFFSLQTYAFNTETIRNDSHKESVTELLKNGANLGKNLYEIKNNYPQTFELISNSMIGIVNEIDGIDVQETFGNYLIGFHEENKQIGIDMVSDGTINLLATITALNQEEDESLLLAFDEPERYLHLKAINYLLENFRSSEKQILITTHSTEILKYANLDEIVFIYRDSDGDTQSMRARDIPDLEGKMERLGYERPLTLDELIASNIVGNFEGKMERLGYERPLTLDELIASNIVGNFE
ncbi:MAG: Unknown protein [uncultured Sulfurovum sp.]|uniref:Uncharacterized protein n=1 Tax=uncultured Sulfurovum sp. TaxID=269237 RepID=A0A6S6T0Y0_9BACT|nr:MAG: Unknown protein [uncultured Sulfurovum sp.]